MSFLRGIEQRIEGVVERGFRRAFRSTLQPVELARKLAREMDDHKTISVQKVYVPNEFTVFLAPADRDGFASYEHSLVVELASYLETHARAEGLSLVAPAVVSLETDADLRPGEFGIACRMAETPAAPPAPAEPQAGVAPAPAEAPAAPAPAPAPAPVESARPNQALAGVSGTQVISAEDAREAGLVPETLTLVMGADRARVTTRVTTLGRSRDCDIVVPDPNVSRVHAEVRHIGMDYYMVDMGSTNGTEVNGQVITRHALADGDVIVMGTTEIRVELR
jgi:hypothetical protein